MLIAVFAPFSAVTVALLAAMVVMVAAVNIQSPAPVPAPVLSASQPLVVRE